MVSSPQMISCSGGARTFVPKLLLEKIIAPLVLLIQRREVSGDGGGRVPLKLKTVSLCSYHAPSKIL
jgi:hypothetical protein